VRSILSDFSAAMASRLAMMGARVLDVGSGDGAFAREMTRAGAEVTGVECSGAQLALCRQVPAAGSERYLYGVGQALPFEDAVFDATVFRASLHHVPAGAMERALGEARRVTRATGEIFVFEPLTTGTHFQLTRLVDDETIVRGQAQAAMQRAVDAGWLGHRHADTLVAEVVYADVDALRRRIVAIDTTRAAAFARAEAEIRRLFDSSGMACEGGRMFLQPFRLDVLA
jgi:SAM-dependent methyltransferase